MHAQLIVSNVSIAKSFSKLSSFRHISSSAKVSKYAIDGRPRQQAADLHVNVASSAAQRTFLEQDGALLSSAMLHGDGGVGTPNVANGGVLQPNRAASVAASFYLFLCPQSLEEWYAGKVAGRGLIEIIALFGRLP